MTANEAEIPNLPIMAKMVVRILYTGLVPEKSRRVKGNQRLKDFYCDSLLNLQSQLLHSNGETWDTFWENHISFFFWQNKAKGKIVYRIRKW